jgi:glyoxylate reductase
LILAVSRRIVEGDDVVRKGLFKGWAANFMLGKELKGSVLGIVGMGRIGLAAALRALVFGMKVIYYDTGRKEHLEKKYGFEYMTFTDLVGQADIVSLHIPSTPGTRHLFNRDVFDMMKRDAIFINASRGDLVDESYLAEKLEKNELFGAGLDVYECEPRVTEKLKQLKNAVLVPHLGSATYTTRLAMAQMTVDNVRQALSGRTPQNLVVELKDRGPAGRVR